MGLSMFFGCIFIAYSPAFAIFLFGIMGSPRLVILCIGSAFFWLLGILFSSIWWFIIPPLRTAFFWTIPWSVFFQELFRFLFFYLYVRAEKGFVRAHQTARLTTHPDDLRASLALGLGSGVTHSMVTYLSILWDATGPGTYFSPSCPSVSLFLISALLSFCFILFHVLWSIVAFEGFREKNYKKMGGVVACHLVASLLTLLNLPGGSCVASVILLFLLLIASAVVSWILISRSTSLRTGRTQIQ